MSGRSAPEMESSEFIEVLERARRLPRADRVRLLEYIEQDISEPVELSPAWKREIGRRLRSLEDGTAVLHDWADVEKELLDLVK